MPDPSDAADPGSHDAVIARQAIVDRQGAIFGYELFDRSVAMASHSASSDAQLLFNVLSHADNSALVDNTTMFINCTHASLAGGHLELVRPERIVLEMPPMDGNGAEAIADRIPALADARRRGLRLAFKHNVLISDYAGWLPLASFIKIDMLVLKPELVERVVRLAQQSSDAQVIAEKVESAQQHEMLQALGVTLFQGFWFSKPVLVSGQSVRPAQAVIIQLIDLVRRQAATAEIEQVLKRDASLSFNLLRFINSSGFGLSVEITSFRHAVMILGLKKLFRWAALLLTTSRAEGVAPAVGTTAIVRGRLMELLAVQLDLTEEADNAFVAGVFSLLDTMLGMPMDKALAAISLPETVVAALLLRRGLLAPLLALVEACESDDAESFARLSDELQLSNHQVNLAHLEALAWAGSLQV